MSVLSAQSIRLLCTSKGAAKVPLITPFVERGVVNGKSYGLSACTYDCRIDHDLSLPKGQCRLASTMEEFAIPFDLCGSVLDKSSYARIFVSAFNTHLDPGWTGFLTVELANLSDKYVFYNKGDPICQIKFEWLDQATDLPYINRKYSNQKRGPQKAIQEEST